MKQPRTRIEPGIWKTSSGSYMVRFYDPLGKERAKNFDRLADARDFKATVRLSKRRGEFVDPRGAKTKVADLATLFFVQKKLVLRRRTIDKYADVARVHLLPVFGNFSVGSLTPDLVQQWVLDLSRREYQPGCTYSAESIRGFYSLFSALMNFAVERELIARSPCRGIDLPRVHRKERRHLSAQDVERLAEAIDPRYKLFVYLCAYLGLRWQEAAGLRQEALDLAPGKVASLRILTTIERARPPAAVQLQKTMAARRTLKMPDFLREAIEEHLANRPDSEWAIPAPTAGFFTTATSGTDIGVQQC